MGARFARFVAGGGAADVPALGAEATGCVAGAEAAAFLGAEVTDTRAQTLLATSRPCTLRVYK